MSEKVRKANEKKPAVGGDGGDAGFTPITETQDAQVCHGPYAETLPVVGKPISEIRRKFADRFGIPKDAQAILDGVEVDDNTVIGNKQILTFVKRAGEKGAGDTLVIEGETVQAISPEGQRVAVPLGALISHLSSPKMDTAGCVLPDGVRAVKSRGKNVIWVHETPPRVQNFKVVDKTAKVKKDGKLVYKNVALSLPYVLTFANFIPGTNIFGACECFFRTSPLETIDDELLYPALMNCVKFPKEGAESQPLTQIITSNLNIEQLAKINDAQTQMQESLGALVNHLFQTGFINEGNTDNWFAASSEKIETISSIEKWHKASAEDGLFSLDVPWMKSGISVRNVIDRIFKQTGMDHAEIKNAADVAAVCFNYKKGGKFEKA